MGLREAVKPEEVFASLKYADEQPRRRPAEEAGDYPHREGRSSKRGTVNNKLRVEQNGAHHKRRKPIVLDAEAGKRRGQRDRAVHAQGGRDAEYACRDHPQRTGFLAPHSGKETVYLGLSKYGND